MDFVNFWFIKNAHIIHDLFFIVKVPLLSTFGFAFRSEHLVRHSELVEICDKMSILFQNVAMFSVFGIGSVHCNSYGFLPNPVLLQPSGIFI